MSVGKASSIGWKTIGLYLSTTVAASILGILASLMMIGLYQRGNFAPPSDPVVSFGCAQEGSYVAEGTDGNVYCSANYTEDDASVLFTINDINGTLAKSSSGARDDMSLSDTIYEGVFMKIVTENIVESFAESNFAAVVFFAILFGVALSRVLDRRQHSNGGLYDKGIILGLFKELDSVLLIIINWIIAITPCKSCCCLLTYSNAGTKPNLRSRRLTNSLGT